MTKNKKEKFNKLSVFTELISENGSKDKIKFPKIWVSYTNPKESLEEDIKDLKKHGVRGVEIQRLEDSWPELLDLGRKYNMKYGISIGDITEKKSMVKKHGLEPEPAIMIGGAYRGQAIDRNVFSFSAARHTIEIEEPVYDKENCYDELGRYFPEMGDPLKAEIVVPLKEYDGEQHLKIIEADISSSQEEHYYQISFDLSGIKGDLSRVGIALYWEYEGTDEYWFFGRGNVTAWADSTREALKKEVAEKVSQLRRINDGKFPESVILARFGDECFYVTGHLNSEECSAPLWDYSNSAIREFKKLRPDDEYPRTWGFPEIYGPDAYGDWMYILHKGCAELCRIVRQAFREEGTNVQVFRNITRANVFNVANYRDGTGLEMLAKELDIAHLDPYPSHGPNDYREDIIPTDMGYVCGIARRYDKPVMPWLQAHSYWASRGGLDHPSPEQIEKMVKQHLMFDTIGLMWLKYPGTFGEKPKTWEKAKKMHKIYVNSEQPEINSSLAVIRFYNIWGLLTADGKNKMDKFITDKIINWLQFKTDLSYDNIEIRNADFFDTVDLSGYETIITSLPPSGKKVIQKINATKNTKQAIIFCNNKKLLNQVAETAGVKEVQSFTKDNNDEVLEINNKKISITRNLKIDINPDAEIEVMASIKENPVIWKYKKIIYVAVEPDLNLDNSLFKWLLEK